MRVLLLILTVGTFSALQAIEGERTTRPGRVYCAPGNCQPTTQPTQPVAPAPQNPAAPQAQLETGGPGAAAQIGSVNIENVNSQVTETVYMPVHYFKKVWESEKYSVQVPVKYQTTEYDVVNKSVPVEKTGTYSQVHNKFVPVQTEYSVQVPAC